MRTSRGENRLSVAKRTACVLLLLVIVLQQKYSPWAASVKASTQEAGIASASQKTVIRLNKTKATLKVGGTLTLSATVTGRKETVKWSSSNKSVASVTSKGKVTAKKNGTATITASANGARAECKITVKKKSTSSGVRNITDSVLKMKCAAAAKYLGLEKKVSYNDTKYGWRYYYYIRKGRRIYDSSSYLEYFPRRAKEKGHWNLFLKDKNIAFQGVKIGMSELNAMKILSKKWEIFHRSYEPYYKGILLTYSRNMGFDWCDGVYLDVVIRNGKVWNLCYMTDGD